MALKVVGAGLGRTGTHSLKIALEKLLNEPCYHMVEVFEKPDHIAKWHAAARGEKVDWEALMEGYGAAVDWPPGAYWHELSEAFPDAIILLSLRDPESWWKSANATIFPLVQQQKEGERKEWYEMVMAIFRDRFTDQISDKAAALAAYDKHYKDVYRRAPKDRLVEWQPSDGWGPLCKALGVPVPDEPFPKTNTTEEFLARRAERSKEAEQAAQV